MSEPLSEENVKARIDFFKDLVKKKYPIRKAMKESKLQPRDYKKYYDEIWSDPEMQSFRPKPRAEASDSGIPWSVEEADRRLREYGVGNRPKTAFETEFEELETKGKTMVEAATRVLEKYGRGAPGTPPAVQTPKTGSDEEKRDVFDEFKTAITNFETQRAGIKETSEKMGLKVEDLYVKREEVEKLVEEAKRAAGEDALDDKRIDAVSAIVRDAVSQIIELFKPAVSSYFSSVAGPTELSPETGAPSGQAPKPLTPEK